jgi:NitT/TauT family transport system substrate-binding protein
VTDFASRTSTTARFESEKYLSWPDVANAFKAGRLDATFMIAPLALKMQEQGVPCKIAYLGHRDGSTVMVAKNDPAKSLKDLKGKTFAIPSKYSNQHLVIRALMEREGMAEGDLIFKELPPPQMPAALASGTIAAYFVGEPHAAKAEVTGVGRVLYKAKDIWPQFISCVLVVSDKLIAEKPALVKDLVRGIAASGEWAETHRDEAAKVAAPYFTQDEKLIKFVLNDPGRVSYRQLTPGDEEMTKIRDMALKAKIIDKPVDVKTFVDRKFIPEKFEAAKIDMTDAGKPVTP